MYAVNPYLFDVHAAYREKKKKNQTIGNGMEILVEKTFTFHISFALRRFYTHQLPE